MKNIYLVPISFQSIKRGLLSCLLALFAFTVQAQVGIGTISPHPSAQLEIQAPLKGLLIPRMPEAFRILIPTPATGLLVYQTDGAAPGFYYFDGVIWQPLKSAASSGGGAIIPYASGAPAVMTTVLGGLLNTGTVLGFGSSATGVTALGGFIDGTSLINMAFTVPRAGTVSSISGTFSSTAAVVLIGSTVTIRGQLYQALPGTNTFVAVPGATVDMAPAATGVISVGTVSSGTTALAPFPVAAGTRLLLVFSASVTAGLDIATVITGYVSAGVGID
ncbi:exosporium glycoprotein BclB-related protein [Dyadobacter endophyticus]|uniref:exosporium glycoprotein BclB-related protein n=1 Tax=Dyadobacter endophyticus TaxID=1749036 RepID=UPI003CF17B8E